MVSRGLKVVIAFVAVMSILQIFIEDIMIFFGATSSGQPGLLNSRIVMMAVPFTIAMLLFIVLVGGAIVSADSFR